MYYAQKNIFYINGMKSARETLTGSEDDSTNLGNPSRYMTITYAVSLSFVALLSIAVHMVLDQVIAQQASVGRLINVSGQQRMLSQRISLFTLQYLSSGDANAKSIAENSLTQLKDNHRTLLEHHYRAMDNGSESPLSDELRSIYFAEPYQLVRKVDKFVVLIEAALSRSQSEPREIEQEPEFFVLAKQPLLASFNAVVYQYERESKQKVDELRTAQSIVLGIIILTLVIEAIFIFRPMVKKVSDYASRLRYEATHDGLSGLFNRRAFNTIAKRFFLANKRYDSMLSLVAVDIDHFKNINDQYGHDVGDYAIQWVAQKMTECLRESDCLARMGGEEFAVLLPKTDQNGALSVAEKICRHIELSLLVVAGRQIPITVSMGLSSYSNTDQTFDDMLKRADRGLYQAKHAGRNRVSCVS